MLNRIFLMLATLCLIAASPAAAQSYPKLLTIRLTNFYPPPNYGGYVIGGCHVNYLVDMALTPTRPTS